MSMDAFEVVIVGGGAAGVSAAKALWRMGCRSVLLIDSGDALGGILLQCAHPGFGRGMDGPTYAHSLLNDFPAALQVLTGVTVCSVSPDKTARLSNGRTVQFRELILATGGREIPIGALPIAGTRPQGVMTAGQLQAMMNRFGFVPNGPAVLLGSGDVGLVMAWQLLKAGVPVTIAERADRITGRAVNKKRLDGYAYRFLPHTTVEAINGYPELESVRLSNGETVPCRLLLSAVGLLPERELLKDAPPPAWVQLAGNCNRIHPMIETVQQDGEAAALAAFCRLSIDKKGE